MDIQVKVANKVASVIGSPVIVCGNSDYNISFDFDTEWEGLTVKTARFVYKKDGAMRFIDAPFTGTVVVVPVLSGIDEVYLGVYAGELHTTTPARILCKQSILCPNPEPAPEPSADVYKQLLEVINNIPGVLPTVTYRNAGKLLKVNEAGDWAVGTDDAVTDIIEGKTSVARAVDADRAKVANVLAGNPKPAQIHYDNESGVANIYGDVDDAGISMKLSMTTPDAHPGYAFYTLSMMAEYYETLSDCAFFFSHEEFGEELITWHKDDEAGELALKGRTSGEGGALYNYFIANGATALDIEFKRIYREVAVGRVATADKATNATHAETADKASLADSAILLKPQHIASSTDGATINFSGGQRGFYCVQIKKTDASGVVSYLNCFIHLANRDCDAIGSTCFYHKDAAGNATYTVRVRYDSAQRKLVMDVTGSQYGNTFEMVNATRLSEF